MIQHIFTRIKNTYGLDVRALSLMRIAAAALLLFDLCIRASSLTEHYTSIGTVPFNAVEFGYWQKGYFSLFQFCDEHWYVLTLFIVTGIFYFFLLVGYKTRLFTFLAWVMLTSLQNRNTLILQGGDDELRLLIFWGMFLPWGNFYSIDEKRKSVTDNFRKYFSVSTIGYILLLFSLYFFSGILKSSAEWDTREGSAFYYTLSLEQMTWPLGKMLLSHPNLLWYISISVKWFEMLTPVLLFIPFRNSLFRMIFILLILFFQLIIGLTMFVGLFYLISIIALIGLLSSATIDKFDSLFNLNRNNKNEIKNNSFLQNLRENYYFKVILNCFLFFCIALSMIWNISSVNGSGLKVSTNFFPVGYSLRLNQNWGMFAPIVLKEDGWFILEGITKNKTKIDVNRNGAPADYTKPESLLKYTKDDRWRKFGENYMLIKNAFMRHYYCEYLIKNWNNNHPENKLDSLSVIYMKELTPPPGKPLEVTKENLCGCKN